MNVINKTISLPGGKEIHIETGRLAKQASGSAVVKCGDTMLLATVVADKESDTTLDFLPLTVDYLEKYASSGKIPGGFFKREGRLGEGEILVSRLVDRALRPLFPDDYHASVHVIVQLISADREEQPDGLACLAACAAIASSDIPFPDLVSEVRVTRKDGEFMINPTFSEMEGVDLDLMVAATSDSIVMVEGEMEEVSEEVMLEAMIFAHNAIKDQNNVLAEIRSELNLGTREYDVAADFEDIREKITAMAAERIEATTRGFLPKEERSEQISTLKKEVMDALQEEFGENEEYEGWEHRAGIYFKNLQKKIVRSMVLNDRVRLDGRKLDEIRPIWSEVGYLPRAHGSSVFTRGETQSLCTATLGTKLDEQKMDGAVFEGTKRFILHYNFPPFSTGEARFLRGPGRREIGHGNLAERALKKVIPGDFDYTVRVVSDILESNGSSSMATVCGGAMCLMDAGVPIKGAVSGIAMGLITDEEGNFAVLSDILGDEDFLGDMDFKVAGTDKGLTACQMDMKVRGLSNEILEAALEQSKNGRKHILDRMLETIEAPRDDYSPYAPRIESMSIPSDMIGAVIGPGGKIIQELQRTTNTTINLEEVGNEGIVTIYSVDAEGLQAAMKTIKSIVAQPEEGATYMAKVKAIKDFGAFVEYMPGREGLLHISEISYKRLESMEGVLEIGEEFPIKLLGFDERTGKARLSRKALLPKPEGYVEPERSNRGNRGGNRNGRGRGRGDGRGRDNRRDNRDK